jgi:glycosyltransferase involved in cell wall biosynthesis
MPEEHAAFPFSITIVIPAYNEGQALPGVLAAVRSQVPAAELLVIDDASSDDTATRAQQAGACVVRHPRNLGNGAAIKSGLRRASGEVVLFMDADGQMDPCYIPLFLEQIASGYDMVVGRRMPGTQGDSLARRLGNRALDMLGSYLVETELHDLTSGYRAVRRAVLLEFIHLLPNRYSYPITSTLALAQAGYSVGFVPIQGQRRQGGRSRQKLLRNGIKFGLIILRMISLFAPLRVYFPVSLLMVVLALASFLVSYFRTDPLRFHIPNSVVILLVGSIIVFMFGLLAEQLAALRKRRDV